MFFHPFVFIIDFIVKGCLGFTAKLRWRYRDFPNNPCPTHAWPPPLSTFLTRLVHLLELMNLHHNHLQSIVNIRVHSLLVMVILWIWSSLQCCTFTTLKILLDLFFNLRNSLLVRRSVDFGIILWVLTLFPGTMWSDCFRTIRNRWVSVKAQPH